jgi:hypothetical protein
MALGFRRSNRFRPAATGGRGTFSMHYIYEIQNLCYKQRLVEAASAVAAPSQEMEKN